ncbi:hypothetical protein SMACR_08060 [Sordaria macrospora]|uniref:WGS project CABT00000000 data, contig 2.50 n=2 Tax=Sordaria macrospora TaxID=5147 RepID=F7W9B3_SORMK|nr:uncharacterized protein SMAC_08060 [Sordaria macrospora k-hell]KAA8631628.1 hypothetical protein SMACR_08060 [Sordaria macrospora]KAH7628827.1 hypothetical protein B0T09DRAFT_344740 [Sordaria sp. MPI-SDFR-AT-0083]WPJ57272.1 hypothetical protein SMAC4_08060 [Sordaria macrospora]CCC05193.1 unnamed protein product [Sordaria macrospora k-hell]
MSEDPNDTFFPTEREEATEWLNSLLNKNLRVSVTDGRMFWGQFKCVDAESNIILHSTYEYRFPTSSQLAAAAAAVTSSLAPSSSSLTPSSSSLAPSSSFLATSSTITASSALSAPSDPSLDPPAPSTSASTSTAQEDLEEAYDRAAASGKMKVDLSSRYLGLVVIPGEYITKIELEEFASQIRKRNKGHGQGLGFHPGWRDAAAASGGIS